MPKARWRIKPAFSMVENSALATASLSGSKCWALAGCVRRWWRIWWQGREAVKPLEDRTPGKSEIRSEINREESSSERRRWQRQRGKAQGRRRAAKILLVGHVQKKIVMVKKVRPKDQNGDWSQLKKSLNCRNQNVEE